jgi:hypothetical protein
MAASDPFPAVEDGSDDGFSAMVTGMADEDGTMFDGLALGSDAD